MILNVFVIFDRKTVQFGNPMFMVNEGQAVRSFTDEINTVGTKESPNMLNSHSDDFDLYALGSYNGDTGLFDTGQPRMILAGSSAKR